MRWILLVLFLTNGVFFSYQWYLNSRLIDYRPIKPESVRSEGVSLKLISEQGATLKKQKLQYARNEQAVAVAGMCVFMGPFQAETSAQTLFQRLLALGVGSEIETIKVASDPDFWVYMEPFVSREEALRQVKAFQSQKIDSFIVTQGEMENGISLGLFTKEKSAGQVLESMRDAGYDAKMKLIERFRNEYWVKIQDAEAKKIADSVWDRIALDYQYIEKEQNLCKPIASSS